MSISRGTINIFTHGFPGDSVVKNLTANAGVAEDMGLMPGLRTSPGGGNENLL